MGRIMAIDYGAKRVGIAVTDQSRIIPTGLTTVHSKDVLSYIENYCNRETVDEFVVGEPRNLDNTPGDIAHLVKGFVRNLHRQFPDKRIHTIDERFTSKIAKQTMLDSGLKKKDRQNKATVDEVSATLILQGFMEQRKPFDS